MTPEEQKEFDELEAAEKAEHDKANEETAKNLKQFLDGQEEPSAPGTEEEAVKRDDEVDSKRLNPYRPYKVIGKFYLVLGDEKFITEIGKVYPGHQLDQEVLDLKLVELVK